MWTDKITEKRVYNLNDCTPSFLFEITNVVKIPPLFHEGGPFGHAGREAALVHAGGVVDGDAWQHTGRDSLGHTATVAQLVEL